MIIDDSIDIIRSRRNERLQEERKSRSMTLEEAAKIIGITKSAYRKLEMGMVKRANTEFIDKLANYYHISPAYLMGFDVLKRIETEKEKSNKKAIYDKVDKMNEEELELLLNFISIIKRNIHE